MKTQSVVQAVAAIILFALLAVTFQPWRTWATPQRPQKSPVAVVPIETPRTPPTQADKSKTLQKKETEPMVVVNLGPCACCGGGECECFPTPCYDLDVTISGTETGLDGSYTAVWQSSGTPRWTFNTGGCDWEIIASGSNGGVAYLREVGGTCQLTGSCSQYNGVATITIKPTDEECDFCELGSLVGSTIKISWPCWYPEYFTVLTEIPDGTCDCSGLKDLPMPIHCGATTPPMTFSWNVPYGDVCGDIGNANVGWACDGSSGRLYYLPGESANYEKQNVKVNELVSGSPITLTKLGSNDSCNWPDTIQIQGHNPGIWCP